MYTYKKSVPLGYADAVAKVKEELNYIILGACNPPLAYQALSAERDIGVLLPSNVIVYVQGGKTFVSAILPTVQLGKVDNPELLPIAEQVENKLKKVVDVTAKK